MFTKILNSRATAAAAGAVVGIPVGWKGNDYWRAAKARNALKTSKAEANANAIISLVVLGLVGAVAAVGTVFGKKKNGKIAVTPDQVSDPIVDKKSK